MHGKNVFYLVEAKAEAEALLFCCCLILSHILWVFRFGFGLVSCASSEHFFLGVTLRMNNVRNGRARVTLRYVYARCDGAACGKYLI